MKQTLRIIGFFLVGNVAFAQPSSAPAPLTSPAMTGPLVANADPLKVDAGPVGDVYVGGVLSGLAFAQSNHGSNNPGSTADIDNAQLVVQKIDGPVQFYVQAGAYALPALGTPYLHAGETTDHFFGPVPLAYVKLVPSESVSVMAGKLPTLIGAENLFSFQNMNIERGLLWSQTNDLNRGVQVNANVGPVSASLALSDGFYSEQYSWLSGLLAYTIDASNTVSLVASGNLGDDAKSTVATPLVQNNSQIYDVIYTYTSGPWTVSPSLQYTHVPEDAAIGIAAEASSYGAALLASYKFDDRWSLAGRAEYNDSRGGTNLMYGPGSNAWSLTVTPTYSQGIYFARTEVSYVKAADTSVGSAFGTDGDKDAQGRVLFETGILF